MGQVLTGRMAGVPLSEAGIAQAAILAARFRTMPVAAVLSSPVQRARETATPIADALGLSTTIDAGLDEIDFGEWTGARFDALEGRADWSFWNRHRPLAGCPDGETMHAAQARAVDAVQRAGLAFEGRAVVIVSHQDVVKAVLAHYLGMTLDHLDRFTLDPASRSVISLFPDGGGRVEGINLPP